MPKEKHLNNNETLPGMVSAKRRKVKLPPYSKLTKQSVQYLDNFVEAVPAARLSRALRDLFFQYLACDECLPDKLPEFSADLYFLFQFLDDMEKEMKGRIEY